MIIKYENLEILTVSKSLSIASIVEECKIVEESIWTIRSHKIMHYSRNIYSILNYLI